MGTFFSSLNDFKILLVVPIQTKVTEPFFKLGKVLRISRIKKVRGIRGNLTDWFLSSLCEHPSNPSLLGHESHFLFWHIPHHMGFIPHHRLVTKNIVPSIPCRLMDDLPLGLRVTLGICFHVTRIHCRHELWPPVTLKHGTKDVANKIPWDAVSNDLDAEVLVKWEWE